VSKRGLGGKERILENKGGGIKGMGSFEVLAKGGYFGRDEREKKNEKKSFGRADGFGKVSNRGKVKEGGDGGVPVGEGRGMGTGSKFG